MLSTASPPKELFEDDEWPAKISPVNAFPEFDISIPECPFAIVVVAILHVDEDNKDVYNMPQINTF